MFEFIKNLFKEKDSSIVISIKDLPNWFEQQLNASKAPVDSRFNALRQKISVQLGSLAENIIVLQKAVLKNPSISTREIQFMEGNREAYIRKVKLLVEALELPEKIQDLPSFQSEFVSKLDIFSTSTAKPYYILQEFFAHESKDIALSIKSIEQSVVEASHLYRQFQESIGGSLNRRVAQFHSTVGAHDSTREMKKRLEQELETEKQRLSSLNRQRSTLQKSDSHKEFENSKRKLELLNNQLKEKKFEIHSQFSILEHGLKKYAKISYEHEDLANSYVDDPVSALLSDHELNVMFVLRNMRQAIEREELELKDKKKDKSLATIDMLDRAFLSRIVSELNSLKLQVSTVEQDLRNHPVDKQSKDLSFDTESCWAKQVQLQKQIEKADKQIADSDPEKLKKELEESLSSFVGKTVSIGD
ncbi:MAG: hypothetical protein V1837_00510 [Candidatus Woesearchaeota archaeon]